MDYKHEGAYKPPRQSVPAWTPALGGVSWRGQVGRGAEVQFLSDRERGWPQGVPQPESMVKSWMSRGFQYRATAELYTRDHT